MPSSGPGSTANVAAAICSFLIPGLGQLVQGRWIKALFFAVLGATVWLCTFGTLGWVVNVIACLGAALHRPRGCRA